MIRDLKAQEFVNRGQRFRVRSEDRYLRAVFGRLRLIADFLAQFLHRRNAGRHGRVDKHRDGKVAVAKHSGNRRQVSANGIATGGIVRIVRRHRNRTALGQKIKMMTGKIMTKAHPFVAAFFHPVCMLRLRIMRMGRVFRRSLRPGKGDQTETKRKKKHLFHMVVYCNQVVVIAN